MRIRSFFTAICIATTLSCLGATKLSLDKLRYAESIVVPASETAGGAVFVCNAPNGGTLVLKFSAGSDTIQYVLRADVPSNFDNDIWKPRIEYSLFKETTTGIYEPVAESQIDADGSVIGVKLGNENGHLKINGNGGKVVCNDVTARLDMLTPGTVVEMLVSKNIKSWRSNDRFCVYPVVENYSELMTGDTDNNWKYFDRITPEGKLLLGGKYVLKMIHDPESPDDFLLLYVGGATQNQWLWHRGDVKARLRATRFEGHYDLEWYDSKRHCLNFETSATFESPDLIRFDLPVLSTQLRFVRM